VLTLEHLDGLPDIRDVRYGGTVPTYSTKEAPMERSSYFVIRHNVMQADHYMQKPEARTMFVPLPKAKRFDTVFAACTALQEYVIATSSSGSSPFRLEIVRVIEETPVQPVLRVEQIT
jgi:hypothetical protein